MTEAVTLGDPVGIRDLTDRFLQHRPSPASARERVGFLQREGFLRLSVKSDSGAKAFECLKSSETLPGFVWSNQEVSAFINGNETCGAKQGHAGQETFFKKRVIPYLCVGRAL